MDRVGGRLNKSRVISLVVEGNDWLICNELLSSLHGCSFCRIEDLNVIFGIHLDTSARGICLVKSLTNTTSIIMEETPVLHELDIATLEN